MVVKDYVSNAFSRNLVPRSMFTIINSSLFLFQ